MFSKRCCNNFQDWAASSAGIQQHSQYGTWPAIASTEMTWLHRCDDHYLSARFLCKCVCECHCSRELTFLPPLHNAPGTLEIATPAGLTRPPQDCNLELATGTSSNMAGQYTPPVVYDADENQAIAEPLLRGSTTGKNEFATIVRRTQVT